MSSLSLHGSVHRAHPKALLGTASWLTTTASPSGPYRVHRYPPSPLPSASSFSYARLFPPPPTPPESTPILVKVVVACHQGLVGFAIVRRLLLLGLDPPFPSSLQPLRPMSSTPLTPWPRRHPLWLRPPWPRHCSPRPCQPWPGLAPPSPSIPQLSLLAYPLTLFLSSQIHLRGVPP